MKNYRGPSLKEIYARLPLRDTTTTDVLFLEHTLLSAMDRAEAGVFVVGDPTPQSRTELLHTLGCAMQWRDYSIISLSLNEPHIPSACPRSIWTSEEDGNFGRLDMLINRVQRIGGPPSNVVIIDSVLEASALHAAMELSKSRLVVLGLSVNRAAEVPRRLIHMGAEPRDVGDQLRGALIQRVYQRPCAPCAQRTDPPFPFRHLEPRFTDYIEGWWLTRNPAIPPHDEDEHCKACDRERTAGELSCYEMFAWKPALREHLRIGDLGRLEQAIEFDMNRNGLETFADRAIRYARRGLVYVEDLREW